MLTLGRRFVNHGLWCQLQTQAKHRCRQNILYAESHFKLIGCKGGVVCCKISAWQHLFVCFRKGNKAIKAVLGKISSCAWKKAISNFIKEMGLLIQKVPAKEGCTWLNFCQNTKQFYLSWHCGGESNTWKHTFLVDCKTNTVFQSCKIHCHSIIFTLFQWPTSTPNNPCVCTYNVLLKGTAGPFTRQKKKHCKSKLDERIMSCNMLKNNF